MSVTMYFWADMRKMPYIQRQVKRLNGRFGPFQPENFGPFQPGERWYISISFTDTENFDQFCKMKRLIEQPFF